MKSCFSLIFVIWFVAPTMSYTQSTLYAKKELYFQQIDVFRQRQLDTLLIVCSHLQSFARQNNDLESEAWALLYSAQAYLKKGKYQTARHQLAEMDSLKNEKLSPATKAFYHSLTGVLKMNIGDCKTAFREFQEGLRLAEKEKDTSTILLCLPAIAQYYYNAGDKLNLQNTALRMRDLSNKSGNNVARSIACQFLCRSATMKFQMDEKTFYTYFDKGHSIAEKYGFWIDDAEYYEMHAFWQKNYNQNEAALDDAKRGANLMEKTGAVPRYAALLSIIGEIYCAMDKKKQATPYFEKAIRLVEQTDDHYNIAITYQGMGIALFDIGNQQEGIALLEKALSICNQNGFISQKNNIQTELARIYGAIQDFQKAYKYQLESDNAKDSLNDMNINRRIIELMLQNEFERKEDSILFQKKLMEKALYTQDLVAKKQTAELEVMGLESDLHIKQLKEKDDSLIRQKLTLQIEQTDKKLKLINLENLRHSEIRQQNNIIFALCILLGIGLLLFGLYQGRQRFLQNKSEIEHLRQLESLRAQIAQDIHDEVGSNLSKIAMGAQFAALLPNLTQEELREKLKTIGSNAHEVALELGEIIFALNPRYDSFQEVQSYFREQASRFLDELDISAHFDFPPPNEAYTWFVSPEIKRQLYLIFKESLNNIVKHANASQINIVFKQSDNHNILLQIQDNGKGFDIARIRHFGIGILGIQERANRIGAKLIMESSPCSGTLIRVEGVSIV